MKYTAIIEECEEGGYFARCAEIKNALTQGETIDETIENLKDAIELVIECEKDMQLYKMKSKNYFSKEFAL
jgi:predicted RNase H-like HicB family nuclease